MLKDFQCIMSGMCVDQKRTGCSENCCCYECSLCRNVDKCNGKRSKECGGEDVLKDFECIMNGKCVNQKRTGCGKHCGGYSCAFCRNVDKCDGKRSEECKGVNKKCQT